MNIFLHINDAITGSCLLSNAESEELVVIHKIIKTQEISFSLTYTR